VVAQDSNKAGKQASSCDELSFVFSTHAVIVMTCSLGGVVVNLTEALEF
jgi:hypothetical protein